MPMVPMNIDNSIVAVASIISAVIAFFFATAVGKIKPAAALALAVIVGFILYFNGVILIGLLIFVGVPMIVAIFKTIASASTSSEPNSEKNIVAHIGYVDSQSQPNIDHGHAHDQFNWGERYLYGQGVPQDHVKAAQWFHKAADQGYADAQSNLGLLYSEGQGVPQDHVQSAQWYRKAADQGVADAQYNLGMLYSEGRGVPQDIIEAWKWLHLAGAGGFSGAFKNLELIEKMLTPDQIAEAKRRASSGIDLKDKATENETWTLAILFIVHEPMVAFKVVRYPVAKIIDQFPVDERGKIKESIDAVEELGFFVIDKNDIQLTDKGETLFEMLPQLCQQSADERLELAKKYPGAASLLTAIGRDSRLSPPLGLGR